MTAGAPPVADRDVPGTDPPDDARTGRGPRRALRLLLAVVVLAALIVAAGIFGVVRSQSSEPTDDAATAPPTSGLAPATGAPAGAGASIADQIADLERRVARTPDDYTTWATLGIAYVQQARITVDPTLYAKAESALDRSLGINEDANPAGWAGRSNLAAARHRFTDARDFAQTGLATNQYSPLLYGALADAETQLGHYDEADAAVQRMLDLRPDTSSLARASYTFELKGDLAQATALMEQARDAAPNGDDKAFALYFLGELAFDQGDANGALGNYLAALKASPQDYAAVAGKAKALAATGQTLTALDTYAALVQKVPDPLYLVPYGRLLDSVGRHDEAAEQYRVAEVAWQLYAANGVEPDADQVLYVADDGDPAEALALAETAVAGRPFLAVHDAYAWALYRNGRFAEAQRESDTALGQGTQNARWLYHAGMIHRALGDDAAARRDLSAALALNPHFDPVDAAVASATLTELGPG